MAALHRSLQVEPLDEPPFPAMAMSSGEPIEWLVFTHFEQQVAYFQAANTASNVVDVKRCGFLCWSLPAVSF